MPIDRSGQAEVYFVPVNEDGKSVDSLLSRLREEEQWQIGSIRSTEGRYRGVLPRLLVRVLACRSLELDNTQLTFLVETGGKPYLDGAPDFHFNYSHTGGGIAVAVAGRPVGVDLEGPRTCRDRVVHRFFAPEEQAYILGEAAPCHLRDQRFCEVWTRKEACAKWSGEGMVAALSAVDTFATPWRERLWTVSQSGYRISLCCEAHHRRLHVLEEADLVAQAEALTPYP